MRQVHQIDGTVGVRIDDRMYRDTDENFTADYGSPPPELPVGINERLYETDKRHAFIHNNNVIDGGPMPWDEGEQILTTLNSLLVAQETRRKAEEDALIESAKATARPSP